ncbi:tRNA (adenosine(37)-N6)-dimethylallyltransferase MiaA [Thermanaerosceptrum fracticalcis]|uniref:tRNA (adenosine(37)-N6)-dimethylallyltransferase MiaA n=1 Tax=Thermanaerosceptrum fracticalcis TaxID=1712410 RepID=UPI00069108F9|nr:tRNA (adenosine(37)-N6)-dimethylallyltransferase MiaA [Thermanaerosceptrum fracticalcis]
MKNQNFGNNRKGEHYLLPVIVIVGPTAVGKSKLGVEVAFQLKGEIISGDSMQVYRGMDIGTAKIKPEEMKGIPHYLIDIKNPDESFSVAEFQKLAEEHISLIRAKNKFPMIVGGTGLYIQSVIDPYEFTEQKDITEQRKKFYTLAETYGKEYLHNLLKEIDPDSAKKIHPNDLKRVTRALEYFAETGRPISRNKSAFLKNKQKYNTFFIGLTMERSILYQRINQRVDQMIEEGLVEEVRELLAKGYSPELPALQGIGYRQIIGYLKNEYDLDHAVYLIKRDTRHFAKRQLTWFRRDPRINWFNVDPQKNIEELIPEIVSLFSRTIHNDVE